MNNNVNDYAKISPTAKIPAYWRSLSDIPYSKEIAEATGAEQTAKEMLGERIMWSGTFSPSMFEARYKSINYALKKTEMDNVMELACGLSPRGLEIVSKGGTYVGTDLLEMHLESSKVIMDIASQEGISTDNLFLQQANVLNRNELKDAAAHFKNQKFAVCNEGLLPYLNKDEKAMMAENIRNLLKGNRGCWITTDIAFRALRESIAAMFNIDTERLIKSAMKNISEQTGRDILGNDFSDKAEAIKFYENLGFTIEEFPMYSGDYKLSTAHLIKDNLKDGFLNILSSSKVSILTPKYSN
jgi:hypothetical protein